MVRYRGVTRPGRGMGWKCQEDSVEAGSAQRTDGGRSYVGDARSIVLIP